MAYGNEGCSEPDLGPGYIGETQEVRRIVTQKSKTREMGTQLHYENR